VEIEQTQMRQNRKDLMIFSTRRPHRRPSEDRVTPKHQSLRLK
jgi:hypothetical protein